MASQFLICLFGERIYSIQKICVSCFRVVEYGNDLVVPGFHGSQAPQVPSSARQMTLPARLAMRLQLQYALILSETSS